MALAEFPITLLTNRVPRDQKEAVYQDEIYDERTGRTLTRKLTISAGAESLGLTTALDDEVIVALIQMTKLRNSFSNRRVEFSRHELIEILGWSIGGASYDRVKTSLGRWTSVYLQYENAWRDNRTKTWKTIGFHIIDKFELNDSRSIGDQRDLIPSYIIWGEDIFESFQAGYLKPLDYDLCMGLSNSTAKRMYRFLDKRFHHKPDWTFGLKEFAHEHIGLGRNYDGPAHLRRKLQPAIEELEAAGFLERLEDTERCSKQGREWFIRFKQKSPALASTQREQMPLPMVEQPPLVVELVKRSVTRAAAAELVKQHPAELIEAKVEVFDWLAEKQDKRIAKSPAGYLCESVRKDYACPQGFVNRAEREAREKACREAERAKVEARRREREQEAREKRDREAAKAYWDSLTSREQAGLQAMMDAEAGPEALAMEKGPLRESFRRLRREEYLCRTLCGRGEEAVGG